MGVDLNNSNFSIAGPFGILPYLLRGLTMLLQPGLRRFLLLPLIINLVLYSAGFWVATHYFSAAMDWMIPGWLEWLRWLLWPLFALILFIIAFFTFTLLTNLIGSPFYGRLAEQVEKMQGGSLRRAEGDAGLTEGLMAEAIRMRYFALRALPILALFVVPVVNFIAPFLWMLFGAWSLSLEYMSYPLEARGIPFIRQKQVIQARRLDALVFGAAVMFGLAVPVLNILIPPAAVIAATLYCMDRKIE